MHKILTSRSARGALLLASLTLLAAPSTSQQASGPVARYTIDAGTMSGMAALSGNGGQGGGMGAAMV